MTAGRAAPIAIDTVVRMLAERIASLAPELLRGGRRAGNEFVCGSLAGEPGTQMAVHLVGAKAGVWKDFRADVAGDALDLVAQVLFRGDKKLALRWSIEWLGLATASGRELEVLRREADARAEKNSAAAEAEREKARRYAHRLWLSGTAALIGTPVEYYLAGRGIEVAALMDRPGALGALRYASNVWCDEAKARMPAMLAAIGAPGRGFLGCHRTYLAQVERNDWRKAKLANAKKSIGSYGGGCISLWRGATGRSFPNAEPGEIVDVTEGIEDGLSVALAEPACRVIAAVSLSNLKSLVLPEGVRHLRIWRQNDTKATAIAAFDAALSALLARGLDVSVASVPGEVKDVNELLQRGG